MIESRKVFWSWQSDWSNDANRGLIEMALEQAVKMLAHRVELDERPELDRDTQGEPGSPDIEETLRAKIAASDVFVADVTFINSAAVERGQRAVPNPNVTYEVGVAAGALGSERIILVFNEASGEWKAGPFDLRQRRILTYCCPERASSETHVSEREKLACDLEAALRETLAFVVREERREIRWGSAPTDQQFLQAFDQAQRKRLRRGAHSVSFKASVERDCHYFVAWPAELGEARLSYGGRGAPEGTLLRHTSVNADGDTIEWVVRRSNSRVHPFETYMELVFHELY